MPVSLNLDTNVSGCVVKQLFQEMKCRDFTDKQSVTIIAIEQCSVHFSVIIYQEE